NRVINSAFTDSVGNFTAPCPTRITAAQCAAARDYVMRGNNVLFPRTSDSNMLFGKLDWQVNDRNSLTFNLNYMDWESPNGIQTRGVGRDRGALSNNADSTVRTRYGRAAWTAIPSSTMVNEARFGWFKDRLYDPNNPIGISAVTGKLGISMNGTGI